MIDEFREKGIFVRHLELLKMLAFTVTKSGAEVGTDKDEFKCDLIDKICRLQRQLTNRSALSGEDGIDDRCRERTHTHTHT